MKDYSNSINEVLGQEQPKEKDYSDSISEVIGQDNLKPNLYAATQISPIEATSQYRLSKQSNIPVEVLKTHANEVKQMTEFNSFDVENLRNNFPKVAIQLQDIAKAPAIRDDISSLSYFERWTQDINQSWQMGKIGASDSLLGEKRLLGKELTPIEQNQLDLSNQYQQKDYNIGFTMGIPSAIAQSIPTYGRAAVSGGIAALPLLLGGPETYLGGVGLGILADIGLQEAGSAFNELSQIKDNQGNSIDPDIIRGASIATGFVNGALEKFGLGTIASKFPGGEKIISGFTRQAIKDKLRNGIGLETFKTIGKSAIESGVAEGSTEGLQQLSQVVFRELAKGASDGNFTSFGYDKEGNYSDPKFWSNALNEIGQAAKLGIQAGGGLGAVGGAMTVAYDRTLAKKQGEIEQSQISDALKTTKESKIFKRDPELFVDATENTLGEQNIYIPADKAKEFFQSEDDYNKFISVVPEAGEQFQEALDVGGNLVLPANKVLSAMAQNPSFEALQEWMKLTPESLNGKEFDDSFFQEILPETQKENSRANEIESNIEKQLTQSGLSPESARLSSQAFKAFYETQSARLGEGQGKQALDKSFDNLIIQNKTAPAFKQISKIDDLDLFIDKARRPQKSVKTGKPLLKMLKDKGGVKLGSNLAGELQHMGINHKTAPGLFRKEGGLGDIDNIPFSEFQDQFPNANLKGGDEDNTYVDPNDLLEAISNEMRGQDISQNVDEQRDVINNFLEELDRYTEVDIKTATNQEVKDAIKKIQEGTYNQEPTKTEAFKKWFGDSKVVDEKGEPLVVYHGTDQKFDEFKKSEINKNEPKGDYFGEAFYFHKDKSTSKRYVKSGEANIMPVYLSIKNPLIIEKGGFDKWADSFGGVKEYFKLSPNKIAEEVRKRGYDGLIDKDYGQYAVLEPTQIKSVENKGTFNAQDPNIYNQGEQKGSIEFNAPDGKTIINLFEGRNASTILHEAGHFFLEVNKQIANFAETPEQVKKDWQSTLDWLGSKDGNFTRDQHEQFARGFEAYLYEGKAPSIELRDTFRRFKSWLVRIYQDIKNLNVKVSKEVAGVFDRMLATDEQIEALKSNPMFRTDPEITKMLTSAEKADYIRRNEKSLEKAKELLLRKTLKQKERENKKFWNEEKEQIRKETEERFNQNPLYNAVHFLKTGKLLAGETELEPFKMDRQSVKDIDAEMIKYLPDGILGKNGANPEIVAETFGFSSADEMFKAMMNLPNMKEEINKSVDEEMYRRYGNMLNDGSLEREALEDIHNEDKGGQIAFEMDVINRKTGKQSINKEQFAIKAREILGSKKVNDAIKPSQYYLAELKASREAGKALGSKDYEKASEWKRKQLLNHYLFKESLLAKKKTEKALKKFSVYSEKQTKGKVKIDEDYRQKIVEILGNYNLAPKLSNAKADRLTAEALSAWMTEKQTNDDAQFITPLELLNARDKTHYRDMTLDEFSSLNDLVENIAAQGRFLRTILIDGKREALAEIGQTLSETIYKNVSEKEKAYETRTTWENTKFAAENFFLNIVKARTLIREMDGFKDLGTAHNYLMRDIDKSSLVRIERSQKVAEDMAAIYKKSFGKKSLAQKVFIPEINKSLSKEAIITVGLNWGNQDNRTKLMDGWNWSEGQANSILRNLTEQDWVYIQDTWNYLNSFWGEVAALEKRRYGVIPEKVQSSPFTIGTKDGKTVSLEGGYYPLKYDDRASSEVGKQGLDDLVKSLRSFSGAQTKRGHTINRVSNVELPVRLDKAPLFQHLDAVVMDLTMSETLENTYKILQNKGVRKAISNTLGKNAFEQLDIWLKDLAAAGAIASSLFEAGLSHMRAGIAISTMAFKISTMVQQITGLAQTFATLGAKYSILGVAKAFGNGNPMQINRNIALVLEKSKFMKNRSTTFHRDIYDAMQTMKGKGEIKTNIIKAGFYGIVKMQMLVDMPTWMGAYQKGLKDFGGNEVKAVELADLYVLRSQGSGIMKDLSGFERGSTSQTTRLSPLVKLFTVFYSYFNTKYNIAYEKVKQTNFKSPKDLAFLATDFAFLFIVEGIMSAALLRNTPDFEDDDDKEAAMIYWGAKLTVQNLASMIPFVSQISSGLQGFDAEPAGLRGAGAVVKGLQAIGGMVEDLSDGEDIKLKAIQTLNGTAGIIFHYPSSQINVILHAMDKANKGDEVNPLNYLIYKQ